MPYREHEGLNLHEGRRRGDSNTWYMRISPISNLPNSRLKKRSKVM